MDKNMNNIFKRDITEYQTSLNPVGDYIEQVSNLMMVKHNITKEKAVALVKEAIKAHGYKIPKIKYNKKNDKGDMEVTEDKLTTYIANVKKEGNLMSPSFTVYKHPSKQESIHAIYLKKNVKNRSQYKKRAFIEERNENMQLFRRFNTLQSSSKVKNNAVSGTYATTSTVLHNPSGHSTLTSTTRSVSGIGNAISELIVGGNKYFRTPESVPNYIAAIINHVNLYKIETMMKKYNMHYPTPLEAFDTIVRTSRWYWRDERAEVYIMHLLENISPLHRAAVVYVNDLWNLKNFNDDLIRDLIGRLGKRVETGSTDPLTDLNDEIDGTNVLAHHIYTYDIKGMEVNYQKLLEEKNDIVIKIASTAKNIKEVLREYKEFFEAFFITDILPTNIAYIRDMMRYNIVLSDTDSTCCSYDKWVKWYYGKYEHSSDGIGIAAAVMTITTQLMEHNLRVFSRNLNSGPLTDNYLQMKNEFFWTVFVPANVTKHYFASTLIKEGNVYRKPKLEKKGVHFISSTVGGDIVARSEEMMNRIMDDIVAGKEISINDLCKEVADIERSILNDFNNGKTYMFSKDSIKDGKSYKNGPEESKFINHILWMNVFSEQFGSPNNPPYAVYKLPLKINNKTGWVEFVKYLEDKSPDIARKLMMFCSKYKKEMIKTLLVPKSLADGKGIPYVIKDYVDIKKIILQSLRSFYYILQTVGYYKKPEFMLMELGY